MISEHTAQKKGINKENLPLMSMLQDACRTTSIARAPSAGFESVVSMFGNELSQNDNTGVYKLQPRRCTQL